MNSSEETAGSSAGRIDSAIQAYADAHEARVVRDVLLDVGTRTEYYAYIVMDRYGLLGIDVQMWPEARISGAGGSARWTARRAGERLVRFDNPIRSGERRISTLADVLVACGRRMTPGYVSDLVVLIADDTSALRLSSEEQLSAIGADGFSEALEARWDFPTNPGSLESGEIDDLVSLFGALNRFDDSEAQARHMGMVRAGKRAVGTWFGRRQAHMVGLADSVVGVAPVAFRLAEARYPAVGESVLPPRRTSPMTYALLVALAGVAIWMIALGGYPLVASLISRTASDLMTASDESATQITSLPRTDPGLAAAQQTLRETDPALYAQVSDLDTPLINHAGEYTLYTWHFFTGDGHEHTITLTFDEAGMLRGANRQ